MSSHVMLYTDDPATGGVAQYNHAVLLALAAEGYRVSCVQSSSDSPMTQAQQVAGVRHHWLGYDTLKDFSRTLTEDKEPGRIFDADRPDLLIFSDCSPVSNLAARHAAMQRGIPFVVVVGFVAPYLAERFTKCLGVLAAHYRAARAVVAVSRENLDLLHRSFGLPAGKGQVIHYGRPEKFFAPLDPAVRERLREELGLPHDAVLSFTSARLARVKGYLYQVVAAKHLMNRPGGERLFFAWAGEGEQRTEIEQAIATARLGSRIRLLGHRWDVADWYDAADIFVLPSDLEGMPLAIMEAMAKGLPVAATAVSGIPEELGDTGKLLPSAAADRVGLINHLIRTLQTWATDAALRHQVGEAGRQRAGVMFREELMTSRTLELVRAQLPAGAPAAVLITA